LDLDWYPFDDHYLATSSMDNSIKVWNVPENFVEDIAQETTTLYGHEKKVCLIQWNPTAAFVLASGGYDSVSHFLHFIFFTRLFAFGMSKKERLHLFNKALHKHHFPLNGITMVL